MITWLFALFLFLVPGTDAVCKSYASLTADEKAILDKHNELRQLHQDTPELCYGETGSDITFSSQTWATELAKSNSMAMAHSKASDYNTGGAVYGENLAAGEGTGSTPVKQDKYISSTQAWYDEIQYWSFATSSKTDSTKPTGHFTQVVWAASQQLNCGYAPYTNDNWKGYHVACQYFPAGNYLGQYAAQVKPLKSTSSPKCSRPTVTNSASVTPSTDIGNGEKYTVTCKSGHTKSGSDPTCTVTGTTASLSALPTCVPGCSVPTVANALSVTPAGPIGNGVSFTVTCNNGYTLSGSGTVLCTVTGTTASLATLPTCTRDDGSPGRCSVPTIKNATVAPQSSIAVGESYTVKCDGSLKLMGDQPTCETKDNSAKLSSLPTCSSAVANAMSVVVVVLAVLYQF